MTQRRRAVPCYDRAKFNWFRQGSSNSSEMSISASPKVTSSPGFCIIAASLSSAGKTGRAQSSLVGMQRNSDRQNICEEFLQITLKYLSKWEQFSPRDTQRPSVRQNLVPSGQDSLKGVIIESFSPTQAARRCTEHIIGGRHIPKQNMLPLGQKVRQGVGPPCSSPPPSPLCSLGNPTSLFCGKLKFPMIKFPGSVQFAWRGIQPLVANAKGQNLWFAGQEIFPKGVQLALWFFKNSRKASGLWSTAWHTFPASPMNAAAPWTKLQEL